MEMTTLDFVILVLAASALVDVWRNGSLFAEFRAYFEVRADGAISPNLVEPATATDEPAASEDLALDEGSTWWMRFFDRIVPGWLAELLSCSFCFSHHTPWIVAVTLYLPVLFLGWPWVLLFKVPLWSLAATRLGNIINALLPQAAGYDRTREDH
jgi:hypothetical protein